MVVKNKEHIIVVFFKTSPGKEEMFRAFLTSINDVALTSRGCIKHDLHQSIDEPTEFMFYESWASKAAHEQHVARPEVKEWRDQLNGFLEGPYEASSWVTVVA